MYSALDAMTEQRALEVWQSLHEGCPRPGCASCVHVDVAADLLLEAARWGESAQVATDVVVHFWARLGARVGGDPAV